MNCISYMRTALLLSLITCAQPAMGQTKSSGFSDKILNLGEIRGLTSFSSRNLSTTDNVETSFLAVWYYNPRPNQIPSDDTFLVIFKQQSGNYEEVFRYTDI